MSFLSAPPSGALSCQCAFPEQLTQIFLLAQVSNQFISLKGSIEHLSPSDFSFYLAGCFFLCVSVNTVKVNNNNKKINFLTRLKKKFLHCRITLL